MKTFFLTIFVTFSFLSKSQSLKIADSLFNAGKVKDALNIYKIEYLKEHNSINVLVKSIAESYALLNKKDSALIYLEKYMKGPKGTVILNTFLDGNFYNLVSEPKFDSLIIALLPKEKYTYPELTRKLWKLGIKDQAFYYQLGILKYDYNNPLTVALWELKFKINSEVLKELEEEIAINGWPKSSIVKQPASNVAFLIIQHADLKSQKKYLPLMTNMAELGEDSWVNVAYLTDRINLLDGKKQIYGTQIDLDEKGKFKYENLIDPEYVNERRFKIGMEPIETYFKRFDLILEISQKTKNK